MIQTRWLLLWAVGLLLPAITIVAFCLIGVVFDLDFDGVSITGPLALPVFLAAEAAGLALIVLPGTAFCVFVATRIEGSSALKAVFVIVSIFIEMVVLVAVCVAVGVIGLMTSGLSGIQ